MRPLDCRLLPPSSSMVHHRGLRSNPGAGDLTDPFAERPVRRALVLMLLSAAPLLGAAVLIEPLSPILLMTTLIIPLIIWPYCLAVIALCRIEQCAGWARKQWRPAIEELEFEPRLVRMLRRHGYGSIASVEQASDRALGMIPNLDDRSLREIRRAIHLRNYRAWQESGFTGRGR